MSRANAIMGCRGGGGAATAAVTATTTGALRLVKAICGGQAIQSCHVSISNRPRSNPQNSCVSGVSMLYQ